ncbi:MAG TPA: tripartite tricarboxylate transporter substrate-binding protein [Xanthobacteraceae bacterium]|nr:tripartite tricarboxylate transporter substrate-binding protein [Xanthobacteraceae bacterium]
MERKSALLVLGFATVLAAVATPAAAQQASGYFAGKTVQMIIGFGPGGGYDRWGRTVAQHMAKHLPGNPTIVSKNLPGAGSFVAAGTLYNTSPKDGTAIGIIARDAPLGPLTGQPGANFDPLKLTWLGSPTTETNVCISYKTSKVKTAQDLLTTELIVGDTGPGTGTHAYPKALNGLIGTKFKLIGGYPSSSDVFLAMERGEVEGICESLDSVSGKRPTWIKDKTVNVLVQSGEQRDEALKDVPTVLELAKTPEQKQAITFLYAGQKIGRPFVAPPGLPQNVEKMLRDAFSATMKDPEFIADAKKQKLEVEPVTGADLEAWIKKVYATPKPLVEKVGELIK